MEAQWGRCKSDSDAGVGMMKATQYRYRYDSARSRLLFLVEPIGDALPDALMWSRVIVVIYEFGDEAT
jgi:hypothetical protein